MSWFAIDRKTILPSKQGQFVFLVMKEDLGTDHAPMVGIKSTRSAEWTDRNMGQQVDFGSKDSGTWGTVKVGRKGWTVTTYSRWIGARSGSIVFVPFAAEQMIKPTDDLSTDWNGCMDYADQIRLIASGDPRCTIRRRGDIVR